MGISRKPCYQMFSPSMARSTTPSCCGSSACPACQKMSRNPTAATIWVCATIIWTSGQPSLLTSQWQPQLVNRQRDPCVRRTFTVPGGWRADRRGIRRAFCDWVPASHKERVQMLAEPNSAHLCWARPSKFSISALTHLRPLPLTGPFCSHAVQAATVRTKS